MSGGQAGKDSSKKAKTVPYGPYSWTHELLDNEPHLVRVRRMTTCHLQLVVGGVEDSDCLIKTTASGHDVIPTPKMLS